MLFKSNQFPHAEHKMAGNKQTFQQDNSAVGYTRPVAVLPWLQKFHDHDLLEIA